MDIQLRFNVSILKADQIKREIQALLRESGITGDWSDTETAPRPQIHRGNVNRPEIVAPPFNATREQMHTYTASVGVEYHARYCPIHSTVRGD